MHQINFKTKFDERPSGREPDELLSLNCPLFSLLVRVCRCKISRGKTKGFIRQEKSRRIRHPATPDPVVSSPHRLDGPKFTCSMARNRGGCPLRAPTITPLRYEVYTLWVRAAGTTHD